MLLMRIAPDDEPYTEYRICSYMRAHIGR